MSRKTAKHNLTTAFQKRRDQAVTKLKDSHHDAISYLARTEVPVDKIGISTMRMLSAGALSSTLLFAPIALPELAAPRTVEAQNDTTPTPVPGLSQKALVQELSNVLPNEYRPLTSEESITISRLLKQTYGIKATFELQGNSLNLQFGRMGYEQHLLRYPGDSINQHDEEIIAGMAPLTGAWSYFAPSKEAMTQKDIEREKYYWAVQTYLSPGWQENMYYLKDWYKYRKMIAVNVKTGDAVVGVIGDAGPAVWTGKHFGGSPEAMSELHLSSGMRNGEVILFFVDDPNDTIPLGKIESIVEK